MPEVPEKYRKYIAAALGAALCLVFAGYDYGVTSNQMQVLPFIEKAANPALFSSDYYVNTLRFFPSFYPYIMALCMKLAALPVLHFVLYCAARFLFLLAGYELAVFLFSSARTGYAAMFMLAVSPLVNISGPLGFDPLMKTSFYQTSAAAPAAVFCLLAFLKYRYIAAAFLLGAVYYLMPLYGNFLAAMLAAAALYRLYRSGRAVLPAFGKAAVVFTLVVLPGVLLFLRAAGGDASAASPDFIIWLKNWFGGHYFLSLWKMRQWRWVVLLLLSLFCLFRMGFSRCREAKTVFAMLAVLPVLWLVAFAGGDIFSVRRIILLQFYRSDVFLVLFGLIFAADYIVRRMADASSGGAAVAAIVLLAFMGEGQELYYGTLLLALILSVRLPAGLISDKVRVGVKRVSAACMLLFFLREFASSPTPLTFCFIPPLLVLLLMPERGISLKAGVGAVAVLLFLPIGAEALQAVKRGGLAQITTLETSVENDWRAVQLWAGNSTAQDASFIVPVNMGGFRTYSRRSVFVEWNDGAAMHWRAGFEKSWAERLERLGYTQREMLAVPGIFAGINRGGFLIDKLFSGNAERLSDPFILQSGYLTTLRYKQQDENVFLSIKRDYGTDYVVEPVSRKLNFPLVYENGTFRVYRIG